MRRLVKRIVALSATLASTLLLATNLFALNVNLTLEAGSLREAGPPRLYGNAVLFSYHFNEAPDSRRIHTVQAAFAHENYSTLHPFRENEHGTFVLILEPPPEITELRYRLIVDGLWTTDPNNDSRVTDRWGVRVSRLELPQAGVRTDYPVIRDNNVVEFIFRAQGGQTVTIVGSFNGWDPFMTRMTESEPGVYTRSVRLAPGVHRYYFMADGVRLPDPRNEQREWNVDGMVVSVVQLR